MEIISWEELQEWTAAGRDFMLIDVREPFERELFHIGGQHIPLATLAANRASIPMDTDVVVYCQKGIRSAIGIQKLEALGYTRLYNLTGGVQHIMAVRQA